MSKFVIIVSIVPSALPILIIPNSVLLPPNAFLPLCIVYSNVRYEDQLECSYHRHHEHSQIDSRLLVQPAELCLWHLNFLSSTLNGTIIYTCNYWNILMEFSHNFNHLTTFIFIFRDYT